VGAVKPRVLDDGVAEVLVRSVRSVCSGTPITGTVYVFTAAHCVLTKSGEVTQRTVVCSPLTLRWAPVRGAVLATVEQVVCILLSVAQRFNALNVNRWKRADSAD